MERIFKSRERLTNIQLYEGLVTEIHEDLYKYIFVIVRNHNIAEDILQESYLQGYKYFSRLRETEKFKSWIFTIAKHEAIRTMKRISREIPTEDQEFIDFIDNSYCTDGGFDNISEINTVIVDIINNLDSESRDIMNLIYYADLPLNEVSVILNIKYNTLKSKHKRIKEKIYDMLQEKHNLK